MGGDINTFTYKSPGLLPWGAMPSPLILKVFPLGVPAGIFKVTDFSRVGILMLEPNAASVKSKGTSRIRSLLLRLKNLCDSTATWTKRSPSGAPASPGPPLPRNLITVPLSTPAGTLTFIDSFSTTEPELLHVLHALSITFPWPLQAEQVCANEKKPWLEAVCPLPLQILHLWNASPLSAPVPLQIEHATYLRRGITVSTPLAAS